MESIIRYLVISLWQGRANGKVAEQSTTGRQDASEKRERQGMRHCNTDRPARNHRTGTVHCCTTSMIRVQYKKALSCNMVSVNQLYFLLFTVLYSAMTRSPMPQPLGYEVYTVALAYSYTPQYTRLFSSSILTFDTSTTLIIEVATALKYFTK